MTSNNMFDEGRRMLEERVFSAENDQKDAEETAVKMVEMCTTLGMSMADATVVPEILKVVNIAWTITRNAPFGQRVHKVSECEADDLACLVEARVGDEANTFSMEGYPASCKLNNTQRKRIYDTYERQQHVDEIVIRCLFEELAEAWLSTLSKEDRELLWNWNRYLQPTSRAEVQAWKNAELDEAMASM